MSLQRTRDEHKTSLTGSTVASSTGRCARTSTPTAGATRVDMAYRTIPAIRAGHVPDASSRRIGSAHTGRSSPGSASAIEAAPPPPPPGQAYR